MAGAAPAQAASGAAGRAAVRRALLDAICRGRSKHDVVVRPVTDRQSSPVAAGLVQEDLEYYSGPCPNGQGWVPLRLIKRREPLAPWRDALHAAQRQWRQRQQEQRRRQLGTAAAAAAGDATGAAATEAGGGAQVADDLSSNGAAAAPAAAGGGGGGLKGTGQGAEAEGPVDPTAAAVASERRLPVVVFVHMTGQSVDAMRSRMEEFAFAGYLAVGVDCRYHGARCVAPEGLPHGTPPREIYQSALVSAWRSHNPLLEQQKQQQGSSSPAPLQAPDSTCGAASLSTPLDSAATDQLPQQNAAAAASAGAASGDAEPPSVQANGKDAAAAPAHAAAADADPAASPAAAAQAAPPPPAAAPSRPALSASATASTAAHAASPAAAVLPPKPGLHMFGHGTEPECPFLLDVVWDLLLLPDVLAMRPDADVSAIGASGVSLGGMIVWLWAAADERVAVIAPLIGVQYFGWAVEHDAWHGRVDSIPGLFRQAAEDLKGPGASVDGEVVRAVWQRLLPGLLESYDMPLSLPLLAPRPLLVANGEVDPRCPLEGVREGWMPVVAAYEDWAREQYRATQPPPPPQPEIQGEGGVDGASGGTPGGDAEAGGPAAVGAGEGGGGGAAVAAAGNADAVGAASPGDLASGGGGTDPGSAAQRSPDPRGSGVSGDGAVTLESGGTAAAPSPSVQPGEPGAVAASPSASAVPGAAGTEEEEAEPVVVSEEELFVRAAVAERLHLFIDPGVGHKETAAMNKVSRLWLDRHLLAPWQQRQRDAVAAAVAAVKAATGDRPAAAAVVGAGAAAAAAGAEGGH